MRQGGVTTNHTHSLKFALCTTNSLLIVHEPWHPSDRLRAEVTPLPACWSSCMSSSPCGCDTVNQPELDVFIHACKSGDRRGQKSNVPSLPRCSLSTSSSGGQHVRPGQFVVEQLPRRIAASMSCIRSLSLLLALYVLLVDKSALSLRGRCFTLTCRLSTVNWTIHE